MAIRLTIYRPLPVYRTAYSRIVIKIEFYGSRFLFIFFCSVRGQLQLQFFFFFIQMRSLRARAQQFYIIMIYYYGPMRVCVYIVSK